MVPIIIAVLVAVVLTAAITWPVCNWLSQRK